MNTLNLLCCLALLKICLKIHFCTSNMQICLSAQPAQAQYRLPRQHWLQEPCWMLIAVHMSHFKLNLKQCDVVAFFVPLNNSVQRQISRFLPSSCQKRGHGVTILHPGRFFWADTSFFAKPLTHFFSLGLEVGCLVLLNARWWLLAVAAATDFTGCNDLIEAWWENGVFTSPYLLLAGAEKWQDQPKCIGI